MAAHSGSFSDGLPQKSNFYCLPGKAGGFPDWFNGQQFLKVQLKGRLTLDQKYQGKDIWVCFRHRDIWYLYPHDTALTWALENKSLGKNPDVWKSGKGAWSYPSPPKDFLQWLAPYALTMRPES